MCDYDATHVYFELRHDIDICSTSITLKLSSARESSERV